MPNQYTHILDVPEVKRFLRLDEDYTDEDQDLENMISGALSFIERNTNHIFRIQSKTYYRGYLDYIDVYDYPINSAPAGVLPCKRFPNYSRYDYDSVTLQIGYTTRDQVPPDLIQAALQMIKVFYYETEKNVNTSLLPMAVDEILNSNKRFFAC